MLIAGLGVFFVVVREAYLKYNPWGEAGIFFMALVFLSGFLINIIGLELLHVIGGLIGGYKVTSVNILHFCLEKRENKWKFCLKEYDGLTGETIIAPRKEKLSLKPYVWAPLFGYATEIALSIVAYSSISKDPYTTKGWLAVVALAYILISSIIALYNFVPLKLDTMTDGYRMILLSKDANIKAYNEYLSVRELHRQNKEVENTKVYEEITEFTASLNIFAIYEFLKNEKYEEAEEVIDLLLVNKDKVTPNEVNRIIAQKLYIKALTLPKEEAKKEYETLCDDNCRRFIANDNSMESLRAYVLIAGMIEESEGEVRFAKSKLQKAKNNALPSVVEVEEKLFAKAIDFVYEKHPKWNKEN